LVLVLELTHLAQLQWAHAAVKLLQAVIGRLGHTHLAAHLGNWRANLGLTQRKRDLLTRKLRLLHAKSPTQISFDLARNLSFSLDTFIRTGSLAKREVEIVRRKCTFTLSRSFIRRARSVFNPPYSLRQRS
jgi:hypothetical protein